VSHSADIKLQPMLSIELMDLDQINLLITQLEARRAQLMANNQKYNEQSAAQNVNERAQRKRTMAVSEASQSEPLPLGRHVVVIGGRGQLGGLFVRQFRQANYRVAIIEADDWPHAADILQQAALVLVAVPIQVTLKVLDRLPPLPVDCVLADITSVKQKPLQAMLKQHQGAVVGLHPMFGPDVKAFKGQTIVLCPGRHMHQYQWLTDQLRRWGANIECISAEEHDKTMAIVQVLRHFSTVVYGAHLAQEQINLDRVLALSSPIYRLELAMVGRLFAQNADLYTEIIFANPANIAMMRRFHERFEAMLALVDKQDKTAFKAEFAVTRSWFGPFAESFLQESSQLLAAAYTQANQEI
jgi:chorismate mutase / prephenate dehydrogenase